MSLSATGRPSALLRATDRCAGIPLLWACGLLHRRRRLPERLDAIGLIKTSCIGDTVLLTGIISDLRRAFPAAKLMLFCGKSNREAAMLIKSLDQVVVLPLSRPLKAIWTMRQHRADVVLDCGQWPRIDALLTWAADAGCTVGFRTAGQFRHYAYDHRVEHSDQLHELDNFRNLVRVLGVQTQAPPTLAPPRDDGGVNRPRLKRPYLVFCPFSSGSCWRSKQWPLGHWAELVDRVTEAGWTVALAGGPGDRAGARHLMGAMPNQPSLINLAGHTTLRQTLGVMVHAACVVSVNTGLMHLAAALGRPVIGLDGVTPTRRWGPIGPKAISIQVDQPGCGFLHLGFECRHRRSDCMGRISVDRVYAAIRSVTSTSQDASSEARP